MNEDFSRLYSRDLPEAEARALEHRIATEPDVAAGWRRFLATMEALDALPDTLPAPPLRKIRRSWTTAVRWALAAAALLALALRPSAPELVLAVGGQLVDGELSLLAGDAIVDVDGKVWIGVEPREGALRVEEPQGDLMQRKTWLAGLAGAAVTVVVYEGSAVVRASPGAEPMTVNAGETHRIPGDAPIAATPRTPEERRLDVARLEAELEAAEKALAEAKFEGALTRGQLQAVQGVPSEWPKDVLPAVSPERFKAELEAQLADVPDVEISHVDCEEYPCIAAIRYTGASSDDSWQKPIGDSVHGWLEGVYGPDGMSISTNTSRFRNGDKSASYVIFGAHSGDDAPDVGTRTEYRIDGLVDDLGAELKEAADGQQP